MQRRKAAAAASKKKTGGVEVEIVGVPTQEELNSFSISTEAETEIEAPVSVETKKQERKAWGKPNENFMNKQKSEKSEKIVQEADGFQILISEKDQERMERRRKWEIE